LRGEVVKQTGIKRNRFLAFGIGEKINIAYYALFVKRILQLRKSGGGNLAPREPFFRGDLTGRRNTMERVLSLILLVAVASGLAGCGVAAFPERVGSAAVKTVPVAGKVVAYPLDVTADAID
jgi:hypothetical protein